MRNTVLRNGSTYEVVKVVEIHGWIVFENGQPFATIFQRGGHVMTDAEGHEVTREETRAFLRELLRLPPSW